MCRSFCALSTAEMALPSDAFGARLNETVIAGNWPWCVIERASVVFSKCAIALNGTALAAAELVEPADVAPLLDEAVELLAVSALAGAASVFAEGVYFAEEVSALEPAEEDAEAENDVEAPGPLVPEAALD